MNIQQELFWRMLAHAGHMALSGGKVVIPTDTPTKAVFISRKMQDLFPALISEPFATEDRFGVSILKDPYELV